MAAPTVTIYLNSGSEETPTWTEVLTGEGFFFGGANSTSGSIEVFALPVAGAQIAPELWCGTVTTWPAGTFTEAATVYDGTVNTNQKVIQVTFASNPTSTAPILTYYDSTSHGATPTDEMATGTSGTDNTGFLKAVDTTSSAPAAAWCSSTTVTTGASTVNCLNGDQEYVQCSTAATANENKWFNLVMYGPSDATAGTAEHDGVLSVKYTHI